MSTPLNRLENIQGLIDSGIRESEVLEYKTASNPFSDSDKKEIAKDISAMANSLGGTIIYGVATKNADKTLPATIDPIHPSNIETFDRVINAQVRPPIVGLRKSVIENKIMVVEVPSSDDPPHQSLYDKKYYRRSGTENLPMEHDLVALKFGRKLSPLLDLRFEPASAPDPQPGAPTSIGEALVRVILLNQGRRLARHILIFLKFPSNESVFVAPRSGAPHNISQQYSGYQVLQVQNDLSVFHPGTNISLLELGINVSGAFMQQHSTDPLVEWILHADEMNPRSGVITIADLGWIKGT